MLLEHAGTDRMTATSSDSAASQISSCQVCLIQPLAGTHINVACGIVIGSRIRLNAAILSDLHVFTSPPQSSQLTHYVIIADVQAS